MSSMTFSGYFTILSVKLKVHVKVHVKLKVFFVYICLRLVRKRKYAFQNFKYVFDNKSSF